MFKYVLDILSSTLLKFMDLNLFLNVKYVIMITEYFKNYIFIKSKLHVNISLM